MTIAEQIMALQVAAYNAITIDEWENYADEIKRLEKELAWENHSN